jgi:hypothetical protein
VLAPNVRADLCNRLAAAGFARRLEVTLGRQLPGRVYRAVS